MIIYAAGDDWLVMRETEVRHIERFPVLQSPTTVIWQPSRSTIGIASFEGDTRHAAVLVERRLRIEGTVEAETKVFIHHVEKVGLTYQALYSTASLDEWHRMQGWASAQAHHCAWTSLTALAWSRVDAQRAVVLHVGNAFIFLGRTGSRIVQANTLAFGVDEDSLAFATRALGDRIRVQWTQSANAADTSSMPVVEWISANELAATETHAAMTGAFSETSGLQVVSLDSVLALAVDNGTEAAVETLQRTGLPTLAKALRLRDVLNTPRERLLMTVEQHRSMVMASTLLVTVLFLGFATLKYREAQRIAAQSQALQARTAAVHLATSTPDDKRLDATHANQLAFIDLVSRLQGGLDVDEVLLALKAAAGADIRILSVRAEERANEQDDQARGVLVDGVLQDGRSNQDSSTLSMFVRSLGALGYAADPVETKAAAAALNVSSQLFTYRLTRKEDRLHRGGKP